MLSGRPDDFAELVRRYQRAVKATALRVLRDSHRAEDAAQDAFVIAYQQLSTLRDPCAFGAWLLTIAQRHAAYCSKGHSRVQGRLMELNGDDVHASIDPDRGALLDAVGELPEPERIVVLLRHFENHSVSDIAAITGRPVGTITKQLSRAHQRLHDVLEDKP